LETLIPYRLKSVLLLPRRQRRPIWSERRGVRVSAKTQSGRWGRTTSMVLPGRGWGVRQEALKPEVLRLRSEGKLGRMSRNGEIIGSLCSSCPSVFSEPGASRNALPYLLLHMTREVVRLVLAKCLPFSEKELKTTVAVVLLLDHDPLGIGSRF